PAPYARRWWVLAVILVAEIMDLLDGTIVNIAAPSIQADLGGSNSVLQWTIAGYTLAFAIMLITGGRLGDIVGRKRMFVIGAAGFTVASVACGLAPSVELLLVARVAQGLFGAALIPQGLGMIKAIFPAKELPIAFGLFGPVIGLSAVAGPILGGFLIEADLFGSGWRSVFLINIPFGIAAIVGAILLMPESKSPKAVRLDPIGVLLISAVAFGLVYPLVQGRELDWPAWCFVMLAAAVVLLGVFVRHERRSDFPLIEPSLLRNRSYTSGLLVIAAFFGALIGFLLVFSVFLQLGLGYSPMKAGLTLAPMSLGMAIGAGLSGALLAPRFGRRILHTGLVVVLLGMVGLWITVQAGTPQFSVWEFAPAMFVVGIGSGLAVAPLFDIILAGVKAQEVGSASGVLTAVQQLGASIGVAVVGTLFFQLLPTEGFLDSVESSLWAVVALFALTLPLVFLLPKKAQHEQNQTYDHHIDSEAATT
ncbi:MAG: DHA2 family efflux MFS transporter permease subunit, partial [Geodermatophilaceae bacterium]|nr:DHA2 family efflux MFS transporter permease subunit [Geodermatophilaceae bacterium]